MSTSSPRRSAPALESLRPPPRLRPAQAAPVRRGQPAGGEGIPGRGATGGCAPAACSANNAICGEGRGDPGAGCHRRVRPRCLLRKQCDLRRGIM